MSQAWEHEHADEVFWGVSEKPSERAAWCHNVHTDYAKAKNLEAASLFTDLQKFYEWVGHHVILREARESGFPMHLAWCLTSLYSGPRRIAFLGRSQQTLQC